MGFSAKHVLVPVALDDTGKLDELAAPAFGCALDLAAAFGGNVHVVSVVDSGGSAAHTPSVAKADELHPSSSDARLKVAGDSLDALVALAKERGMEASRKVVAPAGSIAETVVAEARRVSADAIVVPSHGHRGIKRLVLGSVAEQVARAAGIPVVLLPPERH